MFRSRRRNLRWGDLNMADLELDKLILHFEQSNKADIADIREFAVITMVSISQDTWDFSRCRENF